MPVLDQNPGLPFGVDASGLAPGSHRASAKTGFAGKILRKLGNTESQLRERARKAGARLLYSIPPLTRHDPRGKIVTLKAHCAQIDQFPEDISTAPADWYLPVAPSETVQREPSISLDASQAAQFRAGTERYQSGDRFEIPELFLASASGAKILRQGLITTSRDDDIFVDSAMCKPEVLEAHGLLDALWRPRSAPSRGTYCLLGTPWASGYYHWLLETLPRLALIERFPALADAKLIVPDRLCRFQLESLALAGIPDGRITQLQAPCTQVERLYFPSLPAPTGNPSPRAVAWLRARFLPALPASGAPTRKLYITRRDAPARRLLNEDEIVRFVQRNGFEVVALSELSFLDQIRLFTQARTVLAPHGAGVANILFSPPGATLIEFFGSNYINGCYWALANLCGHRHAFVIGEPTGLDYRVPLAGLRELLTRLECADAQR
jgi:hypothetical protein